MTILFLGGKGGGGSRGRVNRIVYFQSLKRQCFRNMYCLIYLTMLVNFVYIQRLGLL